MVTELLVGVIVTLSIGQGIFAWHYWTAAPRLKRRVIVNLKTGDAHRGIYWERRGPWIVLKDAEHVARGSTVVTAVPGEVLVSVEAVDWIQVL